MVPLPNVGMVSLARALSLPLESVLINLCSFRASTKNPRLAVWLVSGLSYLIQLSFLMFLQNKELKMVYFQLIY